MKLTLAGERRLDSEPRGAAWGPRGFLAVAEHYQRVVILDQSLEPVWGSSPGLYLTGALAWSPDGRLLAVAARYGSLTPAGFTVYDVSEAVGARSLTAWLRRARRLHRVYTYGAVYSLAWSPQGDLLAAGNSLDRWIRVYKVRRRGPEPAWEWSNQGLHRLLFTSRDHLYVYSLSWSPGGDLLAVTGGSGSEGFTALLTRDGVLQRLTRLQWTCFSAAWSPDESFIAVACRDSLHVYDAETGTLVWKSPQDWYTNVLWIDQDTLAATTTTSLHIYTWIGLEASSEYSAKLTGFIEPGTGLTYCKKTGKLAIVDTTQRKIIVVKTRR
ncbi:hypothetical protein Pyrde_0755 [Pyrodictium delaneyi]|uniref:Anaphase-promoting complex subunit 4 WD40 domain-containing protein n=1 Tax=Pyrodictium delaneyi TaxID=1273541 RepID=A0A0P0N2G1_9CREN|nr:hypothetical protein [Pyrodictium delaneyi]ALL00805.1 hypothetical protein Pyrde_0755 [Pyrodictium delaneyi]OWJ55561.1 hypothetical protein Pdsh_01870 [Pyrodictium delaneyi]